MTQRLSPAGLRFDLRHDPVNATQAGLPSVRSAAGRFEAPPGSEFGAAHLGPGRSGHQPDGLDDEDSDDDLPGNPAGGVGRPGTACFTDPGWPAG